MLLCALSDYYQQLLGKTKPYDIFFKYYDCTENLLRLVSCERLDTKMYNGP